jgi:hypothetical protein
VLQEKNDISKISSAERISLEATDCGLGDGRKEKCPKCGELLQEHFAKQIA